MFYIEKNDKPNLLERKLNLLQVNENVIKIPIDNTKKEKQIEKIAKKINKIILKNSNSKKIIISKDLLDKEILINYLNTYGFEIQNGIWLFEILIPQVLDYVIKRKEIKPEKSIVSILINDLTDLEFENIKFLLKKFKNINIITNHIEKFKKLENDLTEEGIPIIITNNKKRSLIKSNIVLNIDFPKELINKYNIKEDSIIINIRGKIKIDSKRFNGLTINDYEIDFRDDIKDNNEFNSKYRLKDIYEGKLYKKQRLQEIKDKIKRDKVIIKKLITINGEI